MEDKSMAIKSKPIQATPVLSGLDAKRIIEQVNTMPTREKNKKNRKMLILRKTTNKNEILIR